MKFKSKFIKIFLLSFLLIFICCKSSFGFSGFIVTDIHNKSYSLNLSDFVMSFKYVAFFHNQSINTSSPRYSCDYFTLVFSNYEFYKHSSESNIYFSDGVGHPFYVLKYVGSSPQSDSATLSYFEKLSLLTQENSSNYFNEFESDLVTGGTHLYPSSVNHFTGPKVIYSNFDVKDSDNNLIHKSDAFSINLSNTDYTTDPIIAYSNYFDYYDAEKYECYISTDAEKWDLMNYETFNDTINNVTKFRFNYKIFENGCYYFKLLNKETLEEKYLSVNVLNILKNSTNSGYNKYGIPQPFCTYERVVDNFIIKTQNLTLEDMKKLQCLYVKDSEFSSDYSTWNKMSMGTYNNIQLNQTEYFFFFTVPKDSEDCIYYFVFYDYNQNKYGWPSSMNCNFDAMNEYADSLSPVEKEKKSKFDELIDFFRDRFGFLVYPFEFIFNILNRFLNIPLKEPIFNIPDIYEPFSNTRIIKAQTFNLNSILNNNTFKTIHNYYLIFVDAFIIICIINLIKNKFKEVSQK